MEEINKEKKTKQEKLKFQTSSGHQSSLELVQKQRRAMEQKRNPKREPLGNMHSQLIFDNRIENHPWEKSGLFNKC